MKAAQGGTPVHSERGLGLEPTRDEALRRLRRELQEIQNKSARAVLGLPEDADATAARTAFLALCKRSHPHAYAHFDSPEISSAATELFIAQKRAWAALNAASQVPNSPRPVLRQQPARGPETVRLSQPSVGPAVAPVQVMRFAVVSGAPIARAQPTVSLRPARSDEQRRGADAELAVAQALKQLAASRFDAALEQLADANRRWPEHRGAEVWLLVCKARKLKAAGLCDEATRAYRAVLTLDPVHQEAQKQVDEARALAAPARRTGRWFRSPED